MADCAVGSDCGSSYIISNYQSKCGDSCENCTVLKFELQKMHDELKSTRLIIDLLAKEAEITKASTRASVNSYLRKYNGTDYSSGASTSRWISIKSSRPNITKSNCAQQTSNLITLSNSFEVLGNLQDSSNKTTNNTTKVHNTLCTQIKRPVTLKKHSVLIVGDSHTRGIAERLLTKLGSSFHIIGYVKPNANLKHITSSVKLELKNFNKHDMVVLCGGTLDVARNEYNECFFLYCSLLKTIIILM